jgi:hypothetical protein
MLGLQEARTSVLDLQSLVAPEAHRGSLGIRGASTLSVLICVWPEGSDGPAEAQDSDFITAF